MSGAPPKWRVYVKSGTAAAAPSAYGFLDGFRALVRRLRPGRPRGSSATALYLRWQEMFESPECWEESMDEDGRVSDAARYRWVAETDWRLHPEDWPPDKFPASSQWTDEMSGDEPYPDRAKRRVYNGIKAL